MEKSIIYFYFLGKDGSMLYQLNGMLFLSSVICVDYEYKVLIAAKCT